MRSPIRPTTPQPASPPPAPTQPKPAAQPPAPPRPPEGLGDNPSAALNSLRQKMETIADEFGKGKINRAQFYAIYNRYREQRAIVERMLEKNPDSNAWKQVIGVKGHTGFLRSHYEHSRSTSSSTSTTAPSRSCLAAKTSPPSTMCCRLFSSSGRCPTARKPAWVGGS
jgi:hypothetical protein